jgi:hypothetical protein
LLFNEGSDLNEPLWRCLNRLTDAKWANSDILLVSGAPFIMYQKCRTAGMRQKDMSAVQRLYVVLVGAGWPVVAGSLLANTSPCSCCLPIIALGMAVLARQLPDAGAS